jgi:hypothetical protein
MKALDEENLTSPHSPNSHPYTLEAAKPDNLHGEQSKSVKSDHDNRLLSIKSLDEGTPPHRLIYRWAVLLYL